MRRAKRILKQTLAALNEQGYARFIEKQGNDFVLYINGECINLNQWVEANT